VSVAHAAMKNTIVKAARYAQYTPVALVPALP
jgi:hypothetical protein